MPQRGRQLERIDVVAEAPVLYLANRPRLASKPDRITKGPEPAQAGPRLQCSLLSLEAERTGEHHRGLGQLVLIKPGSDLEAVVLSEVLVQLHGE